MRLKLYALFMSLLFVETHTHSHTYSLTHIDTLRFKSRNFPDSLILYARHICVTFVLAQSFLVIIFFPQNIHESFVIEVIVVSVTLYLMMILEKKIQKRQTFKLNAWLIFRKFFKNKISLAKFKYVCIKITLSLLICLKKK